MTPRPNVDLLLHAPVDIQQASDENRMTSLGSPQEREAKSRRSCLENSGMCRCVVVCLCVCFCVCVSTQLMFCAKGFS